MKHWGSLCLICLILGGCASDKKIAPTEGRVSLNEEQVISVSQEKQVLGSAEKYTTALINGANAQNKEHHYLVNPSTKSWQVKVGTTTKNELPYLSSVLVSENKIYVLDADFNLFIYDQNGEKLSKTNLKENETGLALTAKKDNFYALSQNGTLIALNKNGKILWQKVLDTPFRNSPVIYKDILYLLGANNMLWALDTKEGKELWHYQTTTPRTTLWEMGRPAVNNDTVVVPFSNGLIMAFQAQNGSFLWETDIIGSQTFNQIDNISQMLASPVIEENTLYLAGHAHSFKAVNLKTGEELWTNSLASTTTPIISGNTLFILDNEGVLYALNKANGKQFWHQKLSLVKGKTFLSLMNNNVVLFTGGQTLMIDAKTGKIKSEMSGDFKTSVPVITQRGLYFLTDNGKLSYQGNLK